MDNIAALHSVSIAAIAQALGDAACRFDIDLIDSCDSSNARLLQRAEAGAASGSVLIAREQTAGRGRRGRRWVSAPGESLTFSLLWRFAPGTVLSGLSLTVGLALVRALEQLGIAGLALKWPNDILLGTGKLAGVLIEVLPSAPQAAVIGIGVNLQLPAAMPAEVRATATALADVAVPPPASRLLACLLRHLLALLDVFAAQGFAPLRADWLQRHAYQGRNVYLLSDYAAPLAARCVGVDDDGALLLDSGTGAQRVISGEVSLRPA